MKRRTLATLLATAAALAVTGCGSSDQEIPPNQANTLERDLAELQAQIELMECQSADDTVSDLFLTARKLPRGSAKDGVLELLDRLSKQVEEACPVDTAPTTTTEPTTTTTEPTTTTTEPTTTTTTEPTTTTTTTTEPTTTTTAPPSGGGGGSGGTGPPSGGAG